MSWMFSLGNVHLNNTTGRPASGGSPLSPLTTPFAVRQGWNPTVAKPVPLWLGGPPMANGQQPLSVAYENVEEMIPFSVTGRDADEVGQAIQALKLSLAGATTTTPVVWRHKPAGSSNEVYAEVYTSSVQETAVDGAISAVEGWGDVEGTITLNRSPFFGADELMRPIAASAVTNGASGNVFSLGDVFGDLAREGQPLNVTLTKPASGSAAGLVLATVASRTNLTIASALAGIVSTTTGSAFTASASFDIAALRRLVGVELRILARLTTLTNPSKGQIAVEVQTAGGVVLWQSSWARLSTDTTAQLIELGGAPLTSLRVPLPAATAANIKVVAYLRSSDGTAVSATLEYLDVLLAHDYCVIDSAGLAAGEKLVAYGAQNLSGGGWLPMQTPTAAVLDGSDIQTKPAKIRGQLIRAFEGASVYVAWVGASRAHTKTDTATITIDHAPLWRSLRGIT
jgi:hypothetical protein